MQHRINTGNNRPTTSVTEASNIIPMQRPITTTSIYEEQINDLKNELVKKDKLLNAWKQDESSFPAEQQKLISMVKQSVISEKDDESRQMAEAAYKAVKTLKQLNEDLKEQVKQRDAQIKNQREDMLKQKETDASIKSNLQLQLLGAGKQALGKLINLTKTTVTSDNAMKSNVNQNNDMALSERDRVIKQLSIQLEAKEKEQEFTHKKLEQQRSEFAALKSQFDDQKRSYESQNVVKELKQLKKKYKEKEEELESTIKAIKLLKNQLITHSEEVDKKEQEDKAKAMQESATFTNNEQKRKEAEKTIVDMTKKLKHANDEIQLLKEKEKGRVAELTSAKSYFSKQNQMLLVSNISHRKR